MIHATAWQQYTNVTDRQTGQTGQDNGLIAYRVNRFWATVCKTVRPMLSGCCLSVCPVCLSVTLVYCGQMVGRIKMKLGMQVGLGLGHILLDWDPAELPLPQNRAKPPVFCAYLLWPNG